jgi:hypothetical protein
VADPWKAIGGLGIRCWDTFVHIGAGDGRDLLQRQVASRRLVLVEGDPAAAALLNARRRQRDDTQVMQWVVAPTTGHAVWYCHNVRAFDGLVRQDTAPGSCFPRLRCVAQRSVVTRSLQSVLEQCLDGVPRDGNHALVVDLPLTQQEWLSTDAAAALARFRALVVTPAARHTAADEPPVALHSALTAAGFMARSQDSSGHLVFELDPLAWQLRQQHAEAVSVLTELQNSVTLLRATRNDVVAELAQAQDRVVRLEAEVHRLRSLWQQNARQHKDVRQAVTHADAALRALGSILGASPGDPA